jgi:ferredoxin-NADP reductase/Na+-translocating ferredoxin:NAD+ oxidoreductase RnfD subunit
MLNIVDDILNRITMYRLALYYLIGLLLVAFVLSLSGVLSYSPAGLVGTVVILCALCWGANTVFARVFKVPVNAESFWITALILALIITPIKSWGDTHYIIFIGWAAILAMASKYILAINKKHIFNPAAFAVALTAFTLNQSASWWVGTSVMLPFVIIGGLLLVRKLQRWDLVLSFMLFAAATILLLSPGQGGIVHIVWRIFASTPLVFFAFVMLTEPLTTPPTRVRRTWYGALTGLLFAPAVHIGSIYSTPELALLIGNVFSYVISPKVKYLLTLKDRIRTGRDTADFVFAPDQSAKFWPGQYLEWTLGHSKSDTRGNRRYFTIASSPTEPGIRLGVKFYPQPSSFKRALLAMKAGDTIIASQLAGEFVLPQDKNKKLVFIAGGIGITPFRSMIKYLIDARQRRDIVLLYSNKTVDEINYQSVFDTAEQNLGIKTVYTLTNQQAVPADWRGHTGILNADIIVHEVPDYQQRMFYISGPRGMVTAFEQTLKGMGIPRSQIKIDFFPGFV